ncbi:integral membrane protein [Teratosphaeria destructans]|uniref:Integral membrane protein n=1 Tax=Teratosphaeria destructans TaxID=418781 RepID=A0A9W7SVM6_9PEZI|nr:integral membrane protein [Teratosphaeria destructans]
MAGPYIWGASDLSTLLNVVLTDRRGLERALYAVHILIRGLTTYNAFLVIVMVFYTFTRYRGMYFWSMILSAFGCVPTQYGYWMSVALGNGNFICKPNALTSFYLERVLKEALLDAGYTVYLLGWWLMVTGQACVLWSRLHLVLHGSRGYTILQWTKWMIIGNIFLLHVPSTILLLCPSEIQDVDAAYRVVTKIQIIGFLLQETTLSSIYIVEAIKVLRSPSRPRTLSGLSQLIAINAIIIVMDLILLSIEMASLHTWQVLIKPLIYSTKLLLEFTILGKIVQIIGGNRLSEDPRRQAAGPFSVARKDTSDRKNADNLANMVHEPSKITIPSKALGVGRARSQTFRGNASDVELDAAQSGHEDNIGNLPSCSSVESPETSLTTQHSPSECVV